MLQVAPVPDVIDVTRLGLRKDGTSIYRPPGEEMFCTSEHRDHEQWLVDIAVLPLPQRVSAEAAAAALQGTDLDYSQREACLGLLTSQRLINCLEAPAGYRQDARHGARSPGSGSRSAPGASSGSPPAPTRPG